MVKVKITYNITEPFKRENQSETKSNTLVFKTWSDVGAYCNALERPGVEWDKRHYVVTIVERLDDDDENPLKERDGLQARER